MEVKNEVLRWRGNKSQEECRALFTCFTPAWHAAKPVVGDVLQYESTEYYEYQRYVCKSICQYVNVAQFI